MKCLSSNQKSTLNRFLQILRDGHFSKGIAKRVSRQYNGKETVPPGSPRAEGRALCGSRSGQETG